MTTKTSSKTKPDSTQPKTPKAALDLLQKTILSKHASKRNLPLPTEGLHLVLKNTIREFEQFAGLPALKTLIIAAYRKGEFKEFKFPELALVEGEPRIIVDNEVYPADKLLEQTFNVATEGKTKDKNCAAYIRPMQGLLKQMQIKLYSSTEEEVDGCLVEADSEELIAVLLEYVFSSHVLDPGNHTVTEWGKDKFCYMVINNRRYFCTEVQLEQFAKRQSENKPVEFCIELTKLIDPATQKEVVYRNSWVNGYKRAKYVKSLFMEYCPEIPKTKEELREVGRVIFRKPLVLKILGLEDGITKQRAKEGSDTLVEVPCKLVKATTPDGREHMIVANGFIARAIEKGVFDVESYDNFTLTVRSVRYYNGYAFNTEWHAPLPTEQIKNDAVLQGVADSLGIEI